MKVCLKQDDNCFNLESLCPYLQKAYYIVSPIDAFMNYTCKNFDEMMIFKAITGSYGYAFWWERTVRYTKVSYVISAAYSFPPAGVPGTSSYIISILSKFPHVQFVEASIHSS